jgi:hypothetical protein
LGPKIKKQSKTKITASMDLVNSLDPLIACPFQAS